MKLKDLGTLQQNSRTKQNFFCFGTKKLKKLGMTPEQLAELTILKPEPFVKNKK